MSGMTFFLQTFGCKSNQYESQAIREGLIGAGLVEVFNPVEADWAVVNTCGVTGRAGASCRNALRRLRRVNAGIRLLVTGCGVDLGVEWPELGEPGPVFVPNAKKHGIVGVVSGGVSPCGIDDDRLGLRISSFHGHTRAFLKVQDGCDNFCTYCAVPFARGLPVSRPLGEILEEGRRLVGSGYREIVLTGINIGAYSWGGMGLGELALEIVGGVAGLERLRLGSVEPPYVTEGLVGAMGSDGRICPHVHLPLQAGDDGLLGLMGRRYTCGEFLERAAMLKEGLENPALTTDIIVGFPGETAGAVEGVRGLCERVGFSRLHVFLFSARPGTVAAGMRVTVTDREVEERKRGLMGLGVELGERYAGSCVGMEERVIVERGGVGLSDRYLRVRLPGGVGVGEVRRVRVTGSDGVDLVGEYI